MKRLVIENVKSTIKDRNLMDNWFVDSISSADIEQEYRFICCSKRDSSTYKGVRICRTAKDYTADGYTWDITFHNSHWSKVDYTMVSLVITDFKKDILFNSINNVLNWLNKQ